MGVSVVVKRQEIPFTYRDYESWPNEERWELIDGEAYDMCAAPSRRHQGVSGVLHVYFSLYFKGKPSKAYAAPFDVVLPQKGIRDWRDSITVVQPDLSVICDKTKLTEKGCLGAPDLAVEIISPYTSKKDLHEKFDLYEREGVREYWIVFPGERVVQIYGRDARGRFDDGDVAELAGRNPSDTVSSRIFPGLSIPMAELFAD